MENFKMIKTCLFCSSPNLETVANLGSFPIFCGVSQKKSGYKFYSFGIILCGDCGLIQQENLINPKILYSNFKNESIGKVWENHNKKLFNFIRRQIGAKRKKILEIGSGSGKIIGYFSDKFDITLCDPNLPRQNFGDHIRVEKYFFENYETKKKFDFIFLSHVFEHLSGPVFCLKKCQKLLSPGGKIVISIPNFSAWFRHFYLNAFSQEHTIYPSDKVLMDLFVRLGFEIMEKELYDNHSIFYSLRPVIKKNRKFRFSGGLIKENKKLISNYIRRLDELGGRYIKKIGDKKYYIFGAHIFAQMLLFYCGLPFNKCLGFLDNAKSKQGRYLYGTHLKCYSPENLKQQKSPVVIVSAGAYTKEIVRQLKRINKGVKIIL